MKKFLFLFLTLVSLSLLFSCNHEHTYHDWQVITEPTCTEKGLREGVCSCGEKSSLYIMCIEHTLDEDNICADCGMRVFNLTASEKQRCTAVSFYSNAQVIYNLNEAEKTETIDFHFTLNKIDETMLDAPAFVDIKILDSEQSQTPLFEDTFAIKASDYSSFFFENNTLKKLLATISIPTTDIKTSAYSNGYLTFKIYNEDYFSFDGEVLEIPKGLPECEHEYNEGICSKCARECEHKFVDDYCEICEVVDPDKINFILPEASAENPIIQTFTDGNVVGQIAIEELYVYKINKTAFGIYIKAKIITPDDGKNYSTSLGYKLYDTENQVIVQSGVLSNEISSCGEYFLIRGTFSSLTPAMTYELKLLQRIV